MGGDLNAYAYVANRPLSYVDPLGLWAGFVGIGAEGGWGIGGGFVLGFGFGGGSGLVPMFSITGGGYAAPGGFFGVYGSYYPYAPNGRTLCGKGGDASWSAGPIQGGFAATGGHLGASGAVGVPFSSFPFGASGGGSYTICGRKDPPPPPDFIMP